MRIDSKERFIVGSSRRFLLHWEHVKHCSQIHRHSLLPAVLIQESIFAPRAKKDTHLLICRLPTTFLCIRTWGSNFTISLCLIQWLFLCAPVILSDNCRTLHINQSLQIITSISMYPQTPIISLSWSPLMTISALCCSPVLTTECYPAVYSCEKQAVCREAKIMKLKTKAALISFNFKKLWPHETDHFLQSSLV